MDSSHKNSNNRRKSLHKTGDQVIRCFKNIYQDKAKQGAMLCTDDWLIDKIKTLAEMLMRRKVHSNEWKEEGPYIGVSGIAFALFRASAIVGESARTMAEQYMNHGVQNQAPKIKERRPRYLGGYLGTLAASLENPMTDRKATEKHVEDCGRIISMPNPPYIKVKKYKIGKSSSSSKSRKSKSKRSKRSDKDEISTFNPNYPGDELFSGRAGFLAAVQWMRQTVDASIVSDDVVRLVLAALLESGTQYAKEKNLTVPPLMFQYHGTEYIGAAHGLSGILSMILCFSTFLTPSDEKMVVQTADWIFSLQDETGNFPSSTKAVKNDADNFQIYWCHGAPGVIYLAMNMWRKYGEERYLNIAIKSANLMWEKGLLRKSPGLCHGIAGNGYAFLTLYRLTNDQVWLDRALVFGYLMMERGLIKKQEHPENPFSLYEGWAGSLCYLIDLLEINRKMSRFPLFPTVF